MAWKYTWLFCEIVFVGGFSGCLLYACFYGYRLNQKLKRDLEAQKNPPSRHVLFEDRRGALALD